MMFYFLLQDMRSEQDLQFIEQVTLCYTYAVKRDTPHSKSYTTVEDAIQENTPTCQRNSNALWSEFMQSWTNVPKDSQHVIIISIMYNDRVKVSDNLSIK